MRDHPSMNGRPDPTLTPARDVPLERRLTVDAAATAGVDAAYLITFAETRAGLAPVRDPDGRDFVRELLEELADARNYVCWALEQVGRGADRNPDLAGEISMAVGQSLAAVTLAFHHANHARDLAMDWRRP